MLRKFIIISLIIALSGCSTNKVRQSYSFLALNTTCSVTIFDSPKIHMENIKKIVLDIENLMSSHIDNSVISKINNLSGSKYFADDQILEVILTSLFYSRISDGIFDISIGPIVDLWGVGSKNYLPSKYEIEALLPLVDYKNIILSDDGFIQLENENMSLDLGAIAKGYAADMVKKYLTEQGVESAIINFGGNITLIGKKVDNSNWKIGIQHPRVERGEYIGIVELNDSSFVSSGDYERFFEFDGVRYHHILNSGTGYPIKGDFISTSIITEKSIDGDALSTITFGSTLEQIKELHKQVLFQGIYITDDKKIYIGQELSNIFTLKDESYRLITY